MLRRSYLAAASISPKYISALGDKALDDSVDRAFQVVKFPIGSVLARPFLSGTQRDKVGGRLCQLGRRAQFEDEPPRQQGFRGFEPQGCLVSL